MLEHVASIHWTRSGPDFLKGKYSREHVWSFDGGLTVPASPSPAGVPEPWSNPANVDPEEAFVVAVASCHMLTFLWLAYKQGFQVESYDDHAVGVMTKNESSVPWVSAITLHPRILFGGQKLPSSAEIQRLHHDAHEQCYIANSIKATVTIADANQT
jgi:organic hydroperoxide reductase OsmC/OhrA